MRWGWVIDTRCIGCGNAGDLVCCECAAVVTVPFETRFIDGIPVYAIGWYRGALRNIVRATKNGNARSALSVLMAPLVARTGFIPATVPVIPVPASRIGYRRRGFSLAHEMARHLGRPPLSALTLDDTGTQRGRGATQRREERRLTAGKGRGPVVVVDDVITTGTTIQQSIRALADAGYTVVCVVVLAIVPPRKSFRAVTTSSHNSGLVLQAHK